MPLGSSVTSALSSAAGTVSARGSTWAEKLARRGARMAAMTVGANATAMISDYLHITPVTSFNFFVYIDGFPVDTLFSEVSGLSFELQVEEVNEGGNNGYTYHLPTGHKHSNLVLKRGVSPMGSALMDWCISTANFKTGKVEPQVVSVMLMAPMPVPVVAPLVPLHTWEFYDAFPVKWQISEFIADKSAYAIESIEFTYSYMEAISSTPGLI
jgi:phage tail-like protein